MKERLKELIVENQQFRITGYISRAHIEVPLNTGLITTLIGARRCGKTYLMYHLMEEIRKSGVRQEQIVFINFEDERFVFTSDNLDLIVQAYQELFPSQALSDTWFFFDEIQNIKGWETFIRRIFDFRTKNIFVTGSNAKLLSSEIATSLRGRTLSYTLFPFSFKEYLQYNTVSPNFQTQSGRSQLLHWAGKFLSDGGFPELLRFQPSLKVEILQQYFNVMIYRDIIERYLVSNPEVLKFFIKKMFASVTVPFSVNKAYNDLKSMGYKISNKYLYEYWDYCQSVFLSQSVEKFSFSEIKQAKSDKKAYIIDNGLLAAIDFTISENRGKLFENMVALEFLKHGNQIFYFKDGHECDFLVRKQKTIEAVQVSWSVSEPATRIRELRGLAQACRFLGVSEGTIITFDEESEIVHDSIKVQCVPFFKYFL